MQREEPATKLIRRNCLECAGSAKSVKFCPCDGKNSTRCWLWPKRFGCSAAAAARRYGAEFVTPGALPDADVPTEDCEKAAQPQKAASCGPLAEKRRESGVSGDRSGKRNIGAVLEAG